MPRSVNFMLYFKHFLLLVLQVIEGKAEKLALNALLRFIYLTLSFYAGIYPKTLSKDQKS
jgi:hypothetical protein